MCWQNRPWLHLSSIAPSCMYRVDIMHRLVFSPTVPDHHHHHTEHCNLCLLFVLLCPPRGCITPCYICCRHAAHMQHVNITDTRVKTTVLQSPGPGSVGNWGGIFSTREATLTTHQLLVATLSCQENLCEISKSGSAAERMIFFMHHVTEQIKIEEMPPPVTITPSARYEDVMMGQH